MKKRLLSTLCAAVLAASAFALPASAEDAPQSEKIQLPPDVIRYAEEKVGTEYINDGLLFITPDRLYLLEPVYRAGKVIGYTFAMWCDFWYYRIFSDRPLTLEDFPDLEGIKLEEVIANEKEQNYQYYLYPPTAGAGWLYETGYPILSQRTDLLSCAPIIWFPALQPVNPEIATTYGQGDVSEDGTVNVRDAVLLARIAAGDKGVPLTAKGTENGDMDYDEIITAEDVTRLTRQLAKQ